MTSAPLSKYVADPRGSKTLPTPQSVEELLRALSSGLRGQAAQQLVYQFLDEHGILAHDAHEHSGVLDMLYRCVDRNLRAGISQQTVREVFVAASPEAQSMRFLRMLQSTGQAVAFPTEVALATTATERHLLRMEGRWFASRKLDGVRCIVVVELIHGRVEQLHTLSRSGRALPRLAALRAQLAADLEAYAAHIHLSDRAFVLDGEICMGLCDTHADTIQEDYGSVMSFLRRHHGMHSSVVYFPFDLLTIDEFVAWRQRLGPEARSYGMRLAPLVALVNWCVSQRPSTMLRPLPQMPVSTYNALPALLDTVTARGWEGLMLRADVAYEGRRTPTLLKLRHMHEAEYIVQDLEITQMRLPLDGIYAERRALASIVIDHRGSWKHYTNIQASAYPLGRAFRCSSGYILPRTPSNFLAKRSPYHVRPAILLTQTFKSPRHKTDRVSRVCAFQLLSTSTTQLCVKCKVLYI